MVPPAFGYSAGDCFQAINLTWKIIQALRESKEASDECRLLIQDLQNLRQILTIIQDLRPSGASLSHVNAIRSVALSCLEPLEALDGRIKKCYHLIATEQPAPVSLRRGFQQTRWRLFATEEIAKSRAVLGAKVASVGLLLGCFNTESLSRIEINQKETKNALLEKAQTDMSLLEESFSKLATSKQQILSRDISEARSDVVDRLSHVEEQMAAQHAGHMATATESTLKIDHLSSLVTQAQEDMVSTIGDFHSLCRQESTNNHQVFLSASVRMQKLEDNVRLIQQNQDSMQLSLPVGLQPMFSRLKTFCAFGAAWLKSLIPYSRTSLQRLLELVRSNITFYGILLRLLNSIPGTLGVADSICFQDALGRSRQLPFEFFHHWEMFETMLHCPPPPPPPPPPLPPPPPPGARQTF